MITRKTNLIKEACSVPADEIVVNGLILVCLLATRGKPKRTAADVRQAIIAPKREHSRKPDGVHASIERLVSGPYLELFARQQRPNWTVWGNQTDKFAEAAE